MNRIWVSLYSPQTGEQSDEMLMPDDRRTLARELLPLRKIYLKLLINEGIAQAFVHPPRDPQECLFAKMSTNYSADLRTRVEPCVFGGTPDCTQCGCAISSGLHSMRTVKVAGPLKMDHLIRSSIGIGLLANRFRRRFAPPARWHSAPPQPGQNTGLVQIRS